MKKVTHNFFLSNQAVCLKHNLLLFDSVHRYPCAVFKQYKRTLTDYYIARYARSGKYKILDKNQLYLIVHHPWFNYYHWMAESIPRIVRYQEYLKDLVLIIPESLYKMPFVKESIKPFIFKEILINKEGFHYFVPQGIISPVSAYCYKYDSALIKNSVAILNNYFLNNKNVIPYRKVYISRLNAARRKFVNEQEVIDLMKKNNFEIVYLENSTLETQIKLFNEVKYFVAMHGAALTNILFMQEETNVLELYREKTSIFDHKSKVYKTLASCMNQHYFELACSAMDKQDDFFKGNLVADINKIENKINEIIVKG